MQNQPSSWEANQSGNIVIGGCKNIQIFRNILGSQALAAIYIETSLVFPKAGIFTIQSNRVAGGVGHGFSMTGSLGVEAEIFVRGNYFTENSGTDIEIPAVNAYVCVTMWTLPRIFLFQDRSLLGEIVSCQTYRAMPSTLAKHQCALCMIVVGHSVFRQFLTES